MLIFRRFWLMIIRDARHALFTHTPRGTGDGLIGIFSDFMTPFLRVALASKPCRQLRHSSSAEIALPWRGAHI